MKRRRIFPRFYEWLSRAEDKLIQKYRTEVAGGAHGRVLELGAGNGMNFAHYPAGTTVVAVEPQPGMLRRARQRAAIPTGHQVHLVAATAEAPPFRDGVFDTAVLSLVMCSVTDPARVAAEVDRVLATGGEVRLFEHVRSPDPGRARWQDRLNRPYGWFTGGCNMNRDTIATLRRAGFAVRFRDLGYGPRLAPHVLGVARRP
ncbi:MAG TPA: class I SAM-dependent methyltransferase [Actinomycetota bacterium]|jgi:SAM-dependent methyltransferase|nr:class I SAM-dependent methyltransferase [Actinomycetota bacterium]